MADRISTMDVAYQTGDLSIFPVSQDDEDILYRATNNAETVLAQSLTFTASTIVANDTSKFPPRGLIRIGTELVYYDSKTSKTFKDLVRGFAGSRRSPWTIGTPISHSVMAEPHNAVKDALINIETNLGLETDPEEESLNGILKSLEDRFLAPKPIFRAAPRKGPASLTVKFQNFSSGDTVRYLWDFGDGSTSVEEAPVHTYVAEGLYAVKLNVITSLGAQGVVTKTDYITVDNDEQPAFFYVNQLVGTTSTSFQFVDQTGGEVDDRYWVFGDGETGTELDGDIHYTEHTYSTPGTYDPVLIVVFADRRLKKISLGESITVT